MVIELLGQSVELSTEPDGQRYSYTEYVALPESFGEVQDRRADSSI